MFQNRSGALALTTLYYDWKKGRNLNLIQTQLGARGEVRSAAARAARGRSSSSHIKR